MLTKNIHALTLHQAPNVEKGVEMVEEEVIFNEIKNNTNAHKNTALLVPSKQPIK
jgi:hypothetical protein